MDEVRRHRADDGPASRLRWYVYGSDCQTPKLDFGSHLQFSIPIVEKGFVFVPHGGASASSPSVWP